MNRPLETEEKIYIHVSEIHAKWSSSLHFGLTNETPDTTLKNASDLLARSKTLSVLPNYNDELCFCLKQDGFLSFSVNSNKQQDIELQYVSRLKPVWLVFELRGKAQAITISNIRMKKRPSRSCFIEYKK